MADMELVIKIPKRVYNYAHKHHHIANSDVLDIKDAIINGTPLPKGHGRLVDADTVIKTIDAEYPSLARQDIKQWIYSVPTIIEADKAESESQERSE